MSPCFISKVRGSEVNWYRVELGLTLVICEAVISVLNLAHRNQFEGKAAEKHFKILKVLLSFFLVVVVVFPATTHKAASRSSILHTLAAEVMFVGDTSTMR